jgi:hypothetical protein
MSPVIVTLPAMKPNMSSAFLPVAVDAASLPRSPIRAFFVEVPAFFTAVLFLGFAMLY